ncbi:MAG TPA: GNAT family N-acetyltransferase [Actinomycetota bacterium]|jgi:ribosomal protein S18 acetylase RimI-like enzyme
MSTTPVVLRDAVSRDLPAVSALLREAYAEYVRDVPPERREAASAYLAEVADVWSRVGTSELVVAEVHGRIAGAVTFYPVASAEGHGWPQGWSALRLLGVDPADRGRGIGRMLTEECLRRARARGGAVLGLHTTEGMVVAKGMYERMGFVRVPEYDFDPSPSIQVIAYKLDL